MNSENNTGLTWTSDEDAYFLRDDEAMDLCDHERYSLFRDYPEYGRVEVMSGPLRWVIEHSHGIVEFDRYELGHFGESVFRED